MKKFKVDFIGIGAAKCGTTWVYKCLLEHPEICGPEKKELNYFVSKEGVFGNRIGQPYKKEGVDLYKQFFTHCKEQSLKGEFSVSYLEDSGSAKLIRTQFPNAKIIVCLRDPVKRAHSFFWYSKKFTMHEKSKNFETALKKNPIPYINNGMYAKLLQPFLSTFSRKNIGIFFMEDIKKDPVKFIQNIYNFLSVNDDFIPPSVYNRENDARVVRFSLLRIIISYCINFFSNIFQVIHMYWFVNLLRNIGVENAIHYFTQNINIKKYKKPKLKEETEFFLREVFRKDIEKLEKITNRNLDSWK